MVVVKRTTLNGGREGEERMHTLASFTEDDGRVGSYHLYFRVALHNLLDPGEWERRVAVVGGLLFGLVYLCSPERGQEVFECIAGLHVGLMR